MKKYKDNFFCPLPWNSIEADPLRQMRPCCDFRDRIKAQTVEEYFQSEQLLQVQKQILNNEIPNGCKRCPEREKFGNSKRTLSLQRQGISCIEDTVTDKILALDIKPTNKCNMSCLSCSPLDSSLVFLQAKNNKDHMDHYIEVYETYKKQKLNNGWDLQFINSLIDRLDSNATVHITGGEPSIAINCLQFLKKLVDRNLTSITIKMHSNFQHHSQEFTDLLAKFDNLIIRASIDAVGNTAEFIRPGTVWQTVESNILSFTKQFPCSKFSINPAMSILNIWFLKDLENWCTDRKYYLDVENVLLWPEYFKINIRENFKQKLLDEIEYSNIKSMIEKDYDEFLGDQCKTNLEKNDKARSVEYKHHLPKLWRMLNVEEKN